ncbi:MAG TPA: PilZ domain-containing protein [Terriglobales bacterium]|nr:PilZ domain-containing protein [Terriglobales bacterium]
MELRKTSRYPLELGVTFQWTNDDQDNFGTGSTRDISAEGMFVFSENFPPCNAQLICEVKAPRSRSAGSLQIKASGRVVRVEDSQRSKRSGFAVFGDMQLFSEDSVSDLMGLSDRIDES